jgi:hypothetical protein
VSDISLDLGPLDLPLIALYLGWPGFGLGGVCGALAWRAHRVWGAVLGAVAGGFVVLAGFLVWAESDLSLNRSFAATMFLALAHGAPGLVAGAAIGAWQGRADRVAGAVRGALVGLTAWLGCWIAVSGTI